MTAEKPKIQHPEQASIEREEAKKRYRKIQAYLKRSTESRGWFRLNPYEEASRQLPAIMRGITSLRASIDKLIPEDTSLINKLSKINQLDRDLTGRESRGHLRREAWKLGSNRVLDAIRLRAKQSMFEVSGKTARNFLLPPSVAKRAEDMAADAGRALSWETISDLPEILGQPNVYFKLIGLYDQGAVLISARMVEQEDNTSEKIVLHMPIKGVGGELDPTVLGCAVEGDQKLYFFHGWEETCSDITPLTPDAPERYIY